MHAKLAKRCTALQKARKRVLLKVTTDCTLLRICCGQWPVSDGNCSGKVALYSNCTEIVQKLNTFVANLTQNNLAMQSSDANRCLVIVG